MLQPPFRIAEFLRIHGEQQYAAARRTAVAIVLFASFKTEGLPDKPGREQFDHHRQRRSLVAAERQLRALQNVLGIVGRITRLVDASAQRHRVTLACRNHDFAARHRSRRLVENQRAAVSTRPAERHRVGAEKGRSRAGRRH